VEHQMKQMKISKSILVQQILVLIKKFPTLDFKNLKANHHKKVNHRNKNLNLNQ